ncbi:MAG TPA: hypothetical protein VIL97_00530 [Thermoanaerobaculia bacterium]
MTLKASTSEAFLRSRLDAVICPEHSQRAELGALNHRQTLTRAVVIGCCDRLLDRVDYVLAESLLGVGE